MESYRCNKCGNDKRFHRQVSIVAKLRVNRKGQDLKTIFDINKKEIDGYYEPVYCTQCGKQVDDNLSN